MHMPSAFQESGRNNIPRLSDKFIDWNHHKIIERRSGFNIVGRLKSHKEWQR
jgi:hypothetical protein